MRFNDERAQKCKWCREIYSRKEPPVEPPCEEQCHIVHLFPENEDVASVFQLCRGQVKTAGQGGQVIDIDLQAVKVICDALEVRNQGEVIQRVRNLFLTLMIEQRNPSLPDGVAGMEFTG